MTTAELEFTTTSSATLSASISMKALVYHGPGQRAWEEKPRPAIQDPKWFKNQHAEGPSKQRQIHERSSRKETVMKFTTHRSSPLFAVISVVVLSFTFVPAQAQAPNDGAALYQAKCALCHGPDGTGKTPVGTKLNVRDLHSPEVQQQSDSDLALVIKQGKGKMPVFGKTLKEDQIKSLVAQIRELGK